jgi:3-phenylpropionate/cinnamic acid dioxygenase small subunit
VLGRTPGRSRELTAVRLPGLRGNLSRRDREEISNALIGYARAVDDGTEADLLAIFTDDVVLEGPLSGRHAGHAGVKAWLHSVPERPPGQDRHLVTNIVISGTRTDATAAANFAHFRTEPRADGSAAGTRLFVAGRFEFSLRRVRGRWLISRRRAVLDALPD